jgi:hypothetical protein
MRGKHQRHALLYSVAGALFLAGTLQAGLATTVCGSGNFYDLSEHFGCSNTGTTSASCSLETELDAYHFISGSYQANAQYGSLDVTSMSDVYDLSGSGFARGGDMFTPGPPILDTILGCLGAILVFAMIVFSPDSVRSYRRVAAGALFLSFVS